MINAFYFSLRLSSYLHTNQQINNHIYICTGHHIDFFFGLINTHVYCLHVLVFTNVINNWHICVNVMLHSFFFQNVNKLILTSLLLDVFTVLKCNLINKIGMHDL